jgi:predicted ATP-binding protein involved in virulence
MYIHTLNLENIKAFERLSLEFARPDMNDDGVYAGINVFVGGNSSGKSTLLKCLAMAVAGPRVASQQVLLLEGWIRRGSEKGQIELRIFWDSKKDSFLGKGSTPGAGTTIQAGLVIESGAATSPTLKEKRYTTSNRTKVLSAERGPWNSDSQGWFLGGYGPFRRLTGSSTESMRYALGKGKLASCVTLFREDAALSESETWLKQEHARALEQENEGRVSSPLVSNAQQFLNDGLLPTGFSISRITVDHVYMLTPNGAELPLRDLSDGCRSAYALMLDIIHNMAMSYGADTLFSRNNQGKLIINQPGVVLIDELEAHLHPSWQRIICEWLKLRFPKIQFFITTHSPLIVQAADPGGVYVLPLPNEINTGRSARRLNPNEQERISLGRAEKVLLGEAFGLKQTWSVRAEELIERWQKLASLKRTDGALAADRQQEYEHLQTQMALILEDEPKDNGGA